MSSQYEALSPWAEADPVPLKGIVPRPADMNGKHIGLFSNGKRAARPILDVVERKLKERFPTLKFSRFPSPSIEEQMADAAEDEVRYGRPGLARWVKGVDAVVGAVGD